jgi:hypothetical protein
MSKLDASLYAEARIYIAQLCAEKLRQAPSPKRGTPERDAQKAVVAWLRKAGCIVAASVNEAPANSSSPVKRARFYASRSKAGVLKGWPDLTVITPAGRVLWIEMKSATGKPTAAQTELHAEMRARGCVVIVARDIWSAQQAIEEAGIVLTWRTTRAEALR